MPAERKALVFFPAPLHPPRAGNQKRALEVLAALRAAGWRTMLASVDSPEWDPAGVEALRSGYVDEVRLYTPSDACARVDRRDDLRRRIEARLRRLAGLAPRTAQFPPFAAMRRWFSSLAEETAPDLLFMNYARYQGVLDTRRFRSVTRVIDSHDLVTLNDRMWQHLAAHLPAAPIDPASVGERLLDENFFEDAGLLPDAEEFSVYDRYDVTIAISAEEAALIRSRTRRTRVVHLPVTHAPRMIPNRYGNFALLATGPNPYNVQAHLYFVRRVLPAVIRAAPGFRLHVTGHSSQQVQPVPGVVHRGFVPDLSSEYAGARLAVCPVFGGTGQQVKIVEAMAHGVPVVALRRPADRSPIVHGVNGLVADDASQFAEHVLRLWTDPALCRRMGEAARETVARECSTRIIAERLSAVVGGERPARKPGLRLLAPRTGAR